MNLEGIIACNQSKSTRQTDSRPYRLLQGYIVKVSVNSPAQSLLHFEIIPMHMDCCVRRIRDLDMRPPSRSVALIAV